MFTNQLNRTTLAHINLISEQRLYGEVLAYHSNIPSTLDDFYSTFSNAYILGIHPWKSEDKET
jgi:hypothetical protein